jgi:Zn-finger nucleic acid-binding protein
MMRLFTRDCPRDGSHLDERHVPSMGVRIDACPKCHGVFLDAEGLQSLTKRKAPTPMRRADFASPLRCSCPACGAALSRRAVSDVAVDACVACGGVWLEAHTLAQLSDAGRVHTPAPMLLQRGLARFSLVLTKA